MASNEQKRALICGVNGQDGALLSKFLLDKGYHVFGTSRDAQTSTFQNLRALGIFDAVMKLSMVPADFDSVAAALNCAHPNEIYYLAGQSSVGLSLVQPAATLTSIALGTLNVLEAIRIAKNDAKFFHASSSECFGDVGEQVADEDFRFKPSNPYGIAKAAAHEFVIDYRERHGLFCSNGILFNHESLLRPPHFVTRKIVNAVCSIKAGSKERLALGALDVVRDWGWAPEYVEAMWSSLQTADPDDYIIATGESHALEEFVAAAFSNVGLNWRAHVDFDPALSRHTEIKHSRGDPRKAARELGWRANLKMRDVIRLLIEASSPR